DQEILVWRIVPGDLGSDLLYAALDRICVIDDPTELTSSRTGENLRSINHAEPSRRTTRLSREAAALWARVHPPRAHLPSYRPATATAPVLLAALAAPGRPSSNFSDDHPPSTDRPIASHAGASGRRGRADRHGRPNDRLRPPPAARVSPHHESRDIPSRRSAAASSSSSRPDRSDTRGRAVGSPPPGSGLGRIRSRCKVCWKAAFDARFGRRDRKSTRLNSSHVKISYAVFCLKKKNK